LNNIKLGNVVRDIVSGFTGTIIQKLEFLNGNVQFGIQPKAEKGDAYPDAMSIDWHTLEVVEDGIADRVTPAVEVAILLGQKVKDKASGFTGIATHKATYINGCVSFGVMPTFEPSADKNTAPQPSWIDHNRLEVIDDGLVADKPRTADINSEAVKRPGGPASKMQRCA